MDHKVNVGNRSATGRNLGAVQIPTPVGFEPTRAEPTGLAGRRLNHSAKASMCYPQFSSLLEERFHGPTEQKDALLQLPLCATKANVA